MSIADHPIEIETDSWIASMQDEEKIKERGEKFMETTKEIVEEAGIPVETKYVVYGHPSKAILETAEEENFGLIILGSHGLGGIKRFILGSVADRACCHTPCPVFTVR